MGEQPLYDLAPLLELMALGAIIALAPLLWVWHRNRGAGPARRLQALGMLTLFLTFDLVLFGAFTRLTDSGLGCPDWPGCYGNTSPLGAHAEITAAQAAMPTGPVTFSKAWVEMIHRYLATTVGVLIIALVLLAWREHRKTPLHGPRHPWWATATLVWVLIQGAFGALTVTMKLFPAIVTLHLLGGLLLLVLLCVQAVGHQQAVLRQPPAPIPGTLRAALWACLALLFAQVALGGWVSTNYAVLACSTFPDCNGQWWPAMDFAQAFEIWRPLGLLSDGSHISFAALTAIHYVHRLAAYGVIAAVVAVALAMRRQPALAGQGRWLLGLIGLQFLTGLSNVVLDWPLVAAVLHTGGAAALVTVMTWALAATRTHSAAALQDDTQAPHGARRVVA
ncbi:COX15/CtaA family protein [Comamonas aquatica]|uniref:COX15/CtaA family protein n=1 Tax=Comamonas aquatica TaxID=225991 RepID=UPI0024472030|nr:COX15/CtaA family protein [Comamonas aquatica]MDH0380902.1 COX15/CtaA family protein [Comamonas aquatica]MDH0429380.1 COX15/CtaA family protein [Comamonas aquatica]MDH0940538.1 COX15/CtaA family protein [Comamonas aquatica]